jgi:hypothetical protein
MAVATIFSVYVKGGILVKESKEEEIEEGKRTRGTMEWAKAKDEKR